MKTYHVQVVMTTVRQVEVEVDDDYQWPEVGPIAIEKAREEFPGFDAYGIDHLEVVKQ